MKKFLIATISIVLCGFPCLTMARRNYDGAELERVFREYLDDSPNEFFVAEFEYVLDIDSRDLVKLMVSLCKQLGVTNDDKCVALARELWSVNSLVSRGTRAVSLDGQLCAFSSENFTKYNMSYEKECVSKFSELKPGTFSIHYGGTNNDTGSFFCSGLSPENTTKLEYRWDGEIREVFIAKNDDPTELKGDFCWIKGDESRYWVSINPVAQSDCKRSCGVYGAEDLYKSRNFIGLVARGVVGGGVHRPVAIDSFGYCEELEVDDKWNLIPDDKCFLHKRSTWYIEGAYAKDGKDHKGESMCSVTNEGKKTPLYVIGKNCWCREDGQAWSYRTKADDIELCRQDCAKICGKKFIDHSLFWDD